MHANLLSLLTILGIAAQALAAPITPITSTSNTTTPSPPSTTATRPAFDQFNDVHVHCPDRRSEWEYYVCYWTYKTQNCDPMGQGTSEQLDCQNLWRYTCGARAHCQVSE
ncbi:hypothetical protein F5Y05DRAFT_416055 [Hypoxylon sp. FL0543]|nr:hypothetical protein F5Y05DRAFT_416055 [Hypoxylon sp. FL0543]